MKPRSSKRAYLLFGAILFVAGGVAWNVLNEGDSSGGLPTTGYVSSVRRDAIGCDSWLPFAAKDCRFVVRIHNQVGGIEQTTTLVEKRFYGSVALSGGEQVSGSCLPGGRCQFEQLRGRPWGLYGVLASLAGIALVGAWLLRRPLGAAV